MHKSKDRGGLGLKKARVQNLALLLQLGWKLTAEEGNLWVGNVRDKYLKNNSLPSWPLRRFASHVWRSIVSTKPILDMGIKWSIGDGKSNDISKDWWCGTGTLELDYPGQNTNNNVRVKELIDDNGTGTLLSLPI